MGYFSEDLSEEVGEDPRTMDEEMGLEPLEEVSNDSEVIEDYHHRGYFLLPDNSTMWSGGKVYYRFENIIRPQGTIKNYQHSSHSLFCILKYSTNVKTKNNKYFFQFLTTVVEFTLELLWPAFKPRLRIVYNLLKTRMPRGRKVSLFSEKRLKLL